MKESIIILMDNGSLRAESTLQLRILATALGERLGKEVFPVSLLHSSKVNVDLLDAKEAQTFVPFLREQRAAGHDDFIVVPLFFGPSGALVDYLPKRVEDLRVDGWKGLSVKVAPTLVCDGDIRIAQIMAELIFQKRNALGWGKVAVAMCDHGTPSKAVNEVRSLVAEQLKPILEKEGLEELCACSMERREGQAYDFNEPLLENLLGQGAYEQKVIISLLFVGPGRHAGENGDIAKICMEAEKKNVQLETAMTELVGSQLEAVVEVLVDRFHQK